MSNLELKAQMRAERGRKNLAGRAVNILPAALYGPKTENKNIKIAYGDFFRIFNLAGSSTVVDLAIGEAEPVKVLIHDWQRDPVSDRFTHVDFYQLDMEKEIAVSVELVLANVLSVEKSTGGEVARNMNSLPVRCLPKFLIKEISVDASQFLLKIGDVLRVKDLQLPEGLILDVHAESAVASVQEIKEEAFETKASAEAAAQNPVTVTGEVKSGEAVGEKNAVAEKKEAGKK